MILDSLSIWIHQIGLQATICQTPEHALAELESQPHQVMITDLMLPGMDGIELMDRARALQPDLQVIVLTSYGSIESAVQAIRSGAFDYLQKPTRSETIQHVVWRALEQHRLAMQGESFGLTPFGPGHTFNVGHSGQAVGRSHQMRHLFELVDLLSDSEASVLISGEQGTGKEVLARLIHAHSARRLGPFVSLDCKAFSQDQILEELFGRLGQSRARSTIGRANDGTLLIKEIQVLTPEVQIRLLHFLQDQTLRNPSGRIVYRPDVRVLASSSVDLEQAVSVGDFREDLYYRLGVVNMVVPPLRERTIDILPLAKHFLKKACGENDREVQRIDRQAIALMMSYEWPGNVTELEEAIHHAVLTGSGNTINADELPPLLHSEAIDTPARWKRSLKEVERQHIERVLDALAWNRTRASEVLGIRRMTLYNKIKEYGLTPPKN